MNEQSVTATGLTAGGKGVSLVVLRQWTRHGPRIERAAHVIPDSDRDGQVTILEGRPIPVHSLFVVVDLATGKSTVGSRDASVIKSGSDRLVPGQLRKVVRDGRFAMFLWARPGVGAWTLTVEDSGMNDDDPIPNGKLALELSRMEPLDDGPPAPTTFERTDVIFAIDPLRLGVTELRAD